jgi:ribonuclease HI
LAKERKYYVVWVGHTPGIFTEWNLAQLQIHGYAGAKYKSFKTLKEAEIAYQRDWGDYYESKSKEMTGGAAKPLEILSPELLKEIDVNSIAVDAACSGNPGKMEYRGVYTLSKEIEVFRSPVFPVGTNNIGEFLAIVHALAMYSEKQPELTIYSDSKLAMGWVKAKQCRTKLPVNSKTEYLHTLVARGETWLKSHKYKNIVKKWETRKWGENPADFGRK